MFDDVLHKKVFLAMKRLNEKLRRKKSKIGDVEDENFYYDVSCSEGIIVLSDSEDNEDEIHESVTPIGIKRKKKPLLLCTPKQQKSRLN